MTAAPDIDTIAKDLATLKQDLAASRAGPCDVRV